MIAGDIVKGNYTCHQLIKYLLLEHMFIDVISSGGIQFLRFAGFERSDVPARNPRMLTAST